MSEIFELNSLEGVSGGATAKRKRDSHRSASSTLKPQTLVECPQCHELKQPHRVCKKCGYYDGKSAVK